MNETMSAADALDRAADALWMYGRATGAGVREDGSMCVVGALEYAQGTPLNEIRGICRFPIGRDELDTYVHDAAWIWNDSLPLSPENDALVIDTLKGCAKDLRNRV